MAWKTTVRLHIVTVTISKEYLIVTVTTFSKYLIVTVTIYNQYLLVTVTTFTKSPDSMRRVLGYFLTAPRLI